MQLHLAVGWAGLEVQDGQVLAVCWTTLVLFLLASPQKTSVCFLIRSSLSSRIAWAFSFGVADLQELK